MHIALSRMALAATFFALVVGFSATTRAQEATWSRLAVTEVPVREGQARMDLSKVRGKFRAFAITSGDSRFTIERISFRYADGSNGLERRRIRLWPGQRSRPLQSSKKPRFVDEAVFRFRVSRGGRGNRVVEVWGLQTRDDRIALRPGAQPDGAASPLVDYDLVASDQKPATLASPTETAALQAPAEPKDATPPLPPRAAPGDTAPAGDVLLGAQHIGFGIDRDVVKVGHRVGKFQRMRLRVLDHDVFLKSLQVKYANGETQDIAVDSRINRGTESAWFDLKPKRFVDRVVLTYRERPGVSGRARVEVFGEHAAGWLGPKGEGRRHNDGWVLLAAQTAGFVGFDKDDIEVGANEGGFKKLRVTVRDRAITLNKIKVYYDDGGNDVIPVQARVDAGSTYGPIALKGTKNRIAKIQALYRSRFMDRTAKRFGSAIVEIWAKH